MKLTTEQKEIVEYVQSLFDKPVYLVGGAVRSILLNEPIKDYDFCSEMSTEEVKEQIKGKHKAYCIGEKFGTIGFKCLGQLIEITQFREEEYATKSRKPNVTFGTDLLTDLSRRDFTINAMALDCHTLEIIDPFDGKKDIKEGVIRAVGNPKIRFKEDPLRILRAIRFATVLGFEIEPQTLKKLKEMAHSLMRISRERWVLGLKMLWEYRVFNFTLPELAIQYGYDQNSKYHDLQLWEHTSKVVEAAQQAGEPIEMLWSALFHDIGKPATRTDKDVPEDKWDEYGRKKKSNYIMHERVGAEIALRLCEYLKFSNKQKEFIVDTIKNHLKDESPLRVYDNMHKKTEGINNANNLEDSDE
jgi:putative nucleotidyltransferase with HDIG domain